MTRKQNKSLAPAAPLNFLLTCSEVTLDNFRSAKMAVIANLRSELHDVLDKLIAEGIEAGLALWFKNHGRDEIKHAADDSPDVLAEAREMIRTRVRSEEELALVAARRGRKPGEAAPLPAQRYAPGKAQVAAVRRYAERNIAEGKCARCPQPLARNSVRLCEKHLAEMAARERQTAKRNITEGKCSLCPKPLAHNSVRYCETHLVAQAAKRARQRKGGHGRQPGTLKALAEAREKQATAALAEANDKPTKRLSRPSLGNIRGTGR